MFKNLSITLPQSIVLAVALLVLGALIFKGIIPATYLTGLLLLLAPSPIQSQPAAPITQNNIEVSK